MICDGEDENEGGRVRPLRRFDGGIEPDHGGIWIACDDASVKHKSSEAQARNPFESECVSGE